MPFFCVDWIEQRVGDKTPADLILFAATEIKVDNSSLTGESEPQERHPVPDGSKYRPVEAENMVRCPNSSSIGHHLTFGPGLQLHARHQRRRMGRYVGCPKTGSSHFIVVPSGRQNR